MNDEFDDYDIPAKLQSPKGEIELKGNGLKGKVVAICISGSVASIETPRLARELRRSGCAVDCFMTSGASEFGVSPKLMEWASGRKVVSEFTGMAEHLSNYDAVVVHPATFNTIRKIVLGIADNAVTTVCASSGIDKLIVVPAMNMKLYSNPLLKEGLEELKKRGATVLSPRIAEGIAKIPPIDEVVDNVFRKIASGKLKSKGILILSGPTRYSLDAVRYISSTSSGGLGAALSKEAFRRGCNVKVITGPAKVSIPEHIESVKVETVEEMLAATLTELNIGEYDSIIFVAAILDFMPSKALSRKVKSDKQWPITLVPTPKLIERISKDFPKLFIVGFKLEQGLSDQELIKIGMARMKEIGASIMVVNKTSQVSEKRHRAYILSKSGGKTLVDGTKQDLAHQIINAMQ